MPTIYYANSAWPIQQSLNEVKHKSGLFTCTATFLRPVGNQDLPTEIQTSIGPVDVWPEPVVATGTDGFQTISATGYGVWDATISEATYGYELGSLPVQWWQRDYCNNPAGCANDVPCGGLISETNPVKYLPVIVESVHVRRLGDSIPPLPTRLPADPESTEPQSPLKILDLNGQDITSKEYNISEFTPYVTPSTYVGEFKKTITPVILPTMVKKNTYGEIVETEVVYSIILDGAATQLNFGSFSSITNC